MPANAEPDTVVVDANVLINLIHVEQLKILSTIPGYRFVVCDQVYREVMRPEQRQDLDTAIANGHLRQESLTEISGLKRYGQLTETMGAGEAECLAMAKTHGWSVLSDEKGLFRQTAIRLLGNDHLFTTPDLFVMAIKSGVLTVPEADKAKDILAQNRFIMKVKTFGDLV